jgi:hypothetical protein
MNKFLKIIFKTVYAMVVTVGVVVFPFVFAFKGVDASDRGFDPAIPILFVFDRAGENVQQFFTFGVQNQAKLQTAFSTERLQEMAVILRRSGTAVSANEGAPQKGYKQAQELLKEHIDKAALILEQEKAKGKDVAPLAKELSDKLVAQDEQLTRTINDQLADLKNKKQSIIDEAGADFSAGQDDRGKKFLKSYSNLNIADKIDFWNAQKGMVAILCDDAQNVLEKFLTKKEQNDYLSKRIQSRRDDLVDTAKNQEVVLPETDLAVLDQVISGANDLKSKDDHEKAQEAFKNAESKIDLLRLTFKKMAKEPGKVRINFFGAGNFKSNNHGGSFLPKDTDWQCDKGVCQGSYERGTLVVLTAQADKEDQPFNSWDGDCSGSGACFLAINGDKAIDIVFGKPKPAVTTLTYTHPSLKFTVKYPSTLKITVAPSSATPKCIKGAPCLAAFTNPAYGSVGANWFFVFSAADIGKDTIEALVEGVAYDLSQKYCAEVKIGSVEAIKYSNIAANASQGLQSFYKTLGIPPEQEASLYIFATGDALVLFGVRQPPSGAPSNYKDYVDINSLTAPAPVEKL